MEKGEAFRCLMKGAYCARCIDRGDCRDIDVLRAKQKFEEDLFKEIIARSTKAKTEEQS